MCVCWLQFLSGSGKPQENSDEWIAYCAFHLGDYRRSLQVGLCLVRLRAPFLLFSLCLFHLTTNTAAKASRGQRARTMASDEHAPLATAQESAHAHTHSIPHLIGVVHCQTDIQEVAVNSRLPRQDMALSCLLLLFPGHV